MSRHGEGKEDDPVGMMCQGSSWVCLGDLDAGGEDEIKQNWSRGWENTIQSWESREKGIFCPYPDGAHPA